MSAHGISAKAVGGQEKGGPQQVGGLLLVFGSAHGSRLQAQRAWAHLLRRKPLVLLLQMAAAVVRPQPPQRRRRRRCLALCRRGLARLAAGLASA